MIEFFGRLHPLILHLPIGVLFIAFIMAWVNRKGDKKYIEESLGLVLSIGMLSAVIAAISGFILSNEGGYEEVLLNRHKWLGIGTAIGSILLYVMHRADQKKLFLPFFMLVIGALMVTGHLGGSLTHGSDFLFEPFAPEEVVESYENLEEAVLFTSLIEPIFKSKCTSCHNTSKLKGDLLLSTKLGIENGGKNGVLFVAGKSASSLMMKRIHLEEEEKKHMPPKGKRQLTDDEIKLLSWWIDEGGSFDQPISELKKTDDIQSILDKYVSSQNDVFALNISPASPKSIQRLQGMGVEIKTLAEDQPFLSAQLNGRKDIDLKTINRLQDISPQLVSLDLGGTNVNDKMIAALKGLEHLQKLYLQKTEISGSSFKALSDLQYLEYLNLFDTKVDDEAMANFESFKGLKNLYVWQTNVSPTAIEKLRSARPLLNIVDGSETSIFGSAQLRPPMIQGEQDIFKDSIRVSFDIHFKNVEIYYTLDGTVPDSNSQKYNGPILLEHSANVQVIAQKAGWETSEPANRIFTLAKYQPESVKLGKKPHQNYPGEGVLTIYDFKKGTVNFREGNWIGYEKEHFSAVFDMGKELNIQGVTASTLEDTGSYIFAPRGMKISLSSDGKNYRKIKDEAYQQAQEPVPPMLKSFSEQFEPTLARYVKVELKGQLTNPDWHAAPGAACWLFIDEIVIE